MTETSPIGLLAPVDDFKVGSCGVLLPNTEAKIVDLESGKPLGPNQRGELCVKGPQVLLSEVVLIYYSTILNLILDQIQMHISYNIPFFIFFHI